MRDMQQTGSHPPSHPVSTSQYSPVEHFNPEPQFSKPFRNEKNPQKRRKLNLLCYLCSGKEIGRLRTLLRTCNADCSNSTRQTDGKSTPGLKIKGKA